MSTVALSRNVFSDVSNGKVAEVICMLKATHAQDDRTAAAAKSTGIVAKLQVVLGKGGQTCRAECR